MIKTKICAECGKLLEQALIAVRQHESELNKGLTMNVSGYLTEELRQQVAPIVVGSFTNAQTAWDAYCDHLIVHGLLTPARKAVQSA
jgi:hypothetical protein